MNANIGLTPTDLVSEYIELRDSKAREVDEHKAMIAEKYDSRMREIEATLLNLFTALGVDNLSAKGVGTAYKKTSTSVTTADASEFRRHVIGSEEWDLVSWIPSKTAVNERVERGEPIPPGVNRSAFVTIGIRRS
jgi:hypothetical protein